MGQVVNSKAGLLNPGLRPVYLIVCKSLSLIFDQNPFTSSWMKACLFNPGIRPVHLILVDASAEQCERNLSMACLPTCYMCMWK